jgi:hypothetical protein
MMSVWFLIPAFFIGSLFGIVLMAICAGAWKDDDRKKKWWEDE